MINIKGISKYDWQYLICSLILVSIFIFTDIFRLIDKEYLLYLPKKISEQPYRIFSYAFIHGDFNHLISNIGGIIMTRYLLMQLEIKSRFFYLQFILICILLNFITTWILERALFYFFNVVTNNASLGFSGIIYAFFGFLFLTTIYGKKYFLGNRINFKKNHEIQKLLFIICIVAFIFSFTPGISLLGHVSGFITGCLIFFL